MNQKDLPTVFSENAADPIDYPNLWDRRPTQVMGNFLHMLAFIFGIPVFCIIAIIIAIAIANAWYLVFSGHSSMLIQAAAMFSIPGCFTGFGYVLLMHRLSPWRCMNPLLRLRYSFLSAFLVSVVFLLLYGLLSNARFDFLLLNLAIICLSSAMIGLLLGKPFYLFCFFKRKKPAPEIT